MERTKISSLCCRLRALALHALPPVTPSAARSPRPSTPTLLSQPRRTHLRTRSWALGVMCRRPSLRVWQPFPPRLDADDKPYFIFVCVLKGPRRNLRNDLLIAADSITNTMSSLVKELNSGGNRWTFAFWTRILELVSMVSPHRGRQRDREHRGFRIWTRRHFGNDLFGILLLVQAEVESLPRFRGSPTGAAHPAAAIAGSEILAYLVVCVELAAQLGLASSDPVSCCRGAGAAEEESFENDLERQLEGELSLEELRKHRQEPDKVCMVRPEGWLKTGRW